MSERTFLRLQRITLPLAGALMFLGTLALLFS
jgi:hypothetical protein